MEGAAERKKRQNCLRQRAWRKRKNTQGKKAAIINKTNLVWRGYGILVLSDGEQHAATNSSLANPVARHYEAPSGHQSYTAGEACRVSQSLRKRLPPWLPYATSSTATGTIPNISFPLSADHRLLTLVQYNLIRAALFNLSILSLLDLFPKQCSRLLQIPAFGTLSPEQVPPDLQPTTLQQSIPHQFWIKAIPSPTMRDNLILMLNEYDDDDLRYDLGYGLYEGFDDTERRGLLVWAEPWRVDGWEVSEGFVRKWGFLLQGCNDLIESTNHCREMRGEDRLIIEI